MTSRRAVLCVPASEPDKVAKALALNADEVVVDLEDAVAPERKAQARKTVAVLAPRGRGAITVRVNAIESPWFLADLAAVAGNDAVATVVIPKVDSADDIAHVERELGRLEKNHNRARPVGVQALIESARGLGYVREIATASSRLVSLVLGYADLGASLGRSSRASWQFAQDAVVLAARIANIDAIDGPLLTVRADEALGRAAALACELGFDGKWVIHPLQIATVEEAFTPALEAVDEARNLLAVMEQATRDGRGAVEWRGRMLDEAVAVQARRVLSKVVGQ
ncbi:MAG: CoA ester lyase [Microbacteriaceae bacterium]|nr:MAG: CoA ester lyase [Microbacteriaceae bacterium]